MNKNTSLLYAANADYRDGYTQGAKDVLHYLDLMTTEDGTNVKAAIAMFQESMIHNARKRIRLEDSE